MDKQETHREKTERVRAAYREARARFARRLREADDTAFYRVPPDGGWSAAQIGWHVAAVDASFAAVISGEVAAAKPLPDGTAARPWAEIAAAAPDKLEAGRRVQPPAEVRREDVLASLDDSQRKLDAALAALSEERAAAFAITHPVLGTVALEAIGEWAAAHVARHNAQAKRVLGS